VRYFKRAPTMLKAQPPLADALVYDINKLKRRYLITTSAKLLFRLVLFCLEASIFHKYYAIQWHRFLDVALAF
jgi:hypothetical protein